MSKVLFFSLVYFLFTYFLVKNINGILPGFICHAYDSLARLLLGSILFWYSFPIVKKLILNKKVSVINKAVFITGCDTGFGHLIAKRLDSKGFTVFASCLYPNGEGAQLLKQTCSSSLHILGLDVTKDDSIQDAFHYVCDNLKNLDLWAVINNAGIVIGSDIECCKVQDIQSQLDVNTLGVVRVTKAFLPLLKKSKGRCVTITSLAARCSVPYIAGYCMSKFATAAFCEILRQETHSYGIKVTTIEPFFFNTPMLTNQIEQDQTKKPSESTTENSSDSKHPSYSDLLIAGLQFLSKIPSNRLHKVVDCVEEAICREVPEDVYTPTGNIFFDIFCRCAKLVPQPIHDFFIGLPLFLSQLISR